MLKPLSDYVVIQPIVQEEKTSSGIYLPDTAHKDKPQQGKVIAVGQGKVLENGTKLPSQLKAGETVIFAKYAGTEIQVDGIDYVVLRENEVLAIVDNKKK